MAAKEERSLIGFDPLAWVGHEENESAEQKQDDAKAVEIAQPGRLEAEAPAPAMLNSDAAAIDSPEDVVILDEVLNIQTIGTLYDRLLKVFEANNKIEIDVSAVKVVDTAVLQLLVILKQEAVKLGKEMMFDFPSENFIEAAQLLGLDALLDVDQPESGLF